ncbi:MAG: DEAD/DEAH box helicase, partial [Desulfobacteraceae bacterium]
MDTDDTPIDPLSRFHPVIARWFRDQYPSPTDIQAEAWALIQARQHVLVTAPTGSGKTLTAFLWAINELACEGEALGHTRVLYVSPLKALNNDIRRNLLQPLDELRGCFEAAGQQMPRIRVLTRSGDTPFSERRRMVRRPPEILITTPESLNLMLASPRARSILGTVGTVILDEIHAVLDTKRGTYLMTAVERLVLLAGEFQRIALSATVNPLETVADFVGGFRLRGAGTYEKRAVVIAASRTSKQYEIKVRFPLPAAAERPRGDALWDTMAEAFRARIGENRSTLVFVNNRQLCEKLVLKINRSEVEPLAYAHHGSLSREIRQTVESHLKNGKLKAIVATNSLELGIDIGPLDEVLLVQCPPSLSAAVQRIGRAGHRVGEVSRASLFPTHARDFLEAAVLARHIPEQAIEPRQPVQAPLDVLAQVIVAMTGVDTWDVDDLYAHLKTCYAFRELSRRQFDLVLQMLAGKYAMSRLRDLKPRVAVDALANTVRARKGALMAVYMSGGVIPDRGYYHLRHARSGARIGELDEEFVWEAKVGQTFNLGAQKWRIEKITAGEVLVVPGHPNALGTPFWKGEAFQRDWHFSEKILHFLQEADRSMGDPAWRESVQERSRMEASAADGLMAFLKSQKEAVHAPLPHRHHMVVEFVHSAPGSAPGNQAVLLNFWGGKVNQPLALALDAAWHEKFGQRLEIFAGNDAVALLLPHEVTAEELLAMVNSRNLDQLLRKRLESSGIFGARFRECAGRALLLTRPNFKKRMPLWMSRLRSQKLFNAVRQYEDFPILLETWRTCLQDEFDLERLRSLLEEVEAGAIAWSEVHTDQASPMARQMAWFQINKYMYMDDTPSDDRPSKLSGDLLHEIVHSPALRPSVSRDVADRFEQKSLRLVPGYAPSDGQDLVEWVKERLLIPDTEWRALLGLMEREAEIPRDEWLQAAAPRLVRMELPGAREPLIAAREMLTPIMTALPHSEEHVIINGLAPDSAGVASAPTDGAGDADTAELDMGWLLGEWLQFYGPVPAEFVAGALGIEMPQAAAGLDQLVEDQRLIWGPLIKKEEERFYCDARNFEMLLRLERRAAQPVVAPQPCEGLALFLARVQGLVPGSADRRDPVERLLDIGEQMSGYALGAHLWEGEILPARMPAYDPSWLDSLMQTTDLQWIGRENRQLFFCFEPDLDLLMGTGPEALEEEDGPGAQAPPAAKTRLDKVLDSAGRYDFSALCHLAEISPAQASRQLWEGVWQGVYSNDAFAAVRQGLATGFKPPQAGAPARHGIRSRRGAGRKAFSRWKAALPRAGNWFKIVVPVLEDDLLSQQERQKDRIRLLLQRYGILFRELLAREMPMFRWAALVRTLRLMDLSGEIHSGCFFQGIAGLQFIAPEYLSLLQQDAETKPIYWLNAVDPASMCGLGLNELPHALPRRIASNHLVYRGAELIATSRRKGGRIRFEMAPDDPDLSAALGFLHHLLNRRFQPLRHITVETINGRPATESPYLPA